MECSYCGKELNMYEEVIEKNYELICKDCVEERNVTFYIVGGESIGTDDEIGGWKLLSDYIKYLEDLKTNTINKIKTLEDEIKNKDKFYTVSKYELNLYQNKLNDINEFLEESSEEINDFKKKTKKYMKWSYLEKGTKVKVRNTDKEEWQVGVFIRVSPLQEKPFLVKIHDKFIDRFKQIKEVE